MRRCHAHGTSSSACASAAGRLTLVVVEDRERAGSAGRERERELVVRLALDGRRPLRPNCGRPRGASGRLVVAPDRMRGRDDVVADDRALRHAQPHPGQRARGDPRSRARAVRSLEDREPWSRLERGQVVVRAGSVADPEVVEPLGGGAVRQRQCPAVAVAVRRPATHLDRAEGLVVLTVMEALAIAPAELPGAGCVVRDRVARRVLGAECEGRPTHGVRAELHVHDHRRIGVDRPADCGDQDEGDDYRCCEQGDRAGAPEHEHLPRDDGRS